MTAPLRAAVLGHPIEHSLSPILHRTAWAWGGLTGEYTAIDVSAEALADWCRDVLDASWTGLSLTMPLKEAVLPLLSTASSTVTATASANTVLRDDAGLLHGHNTDVPGMVAALRGSGITRPRTAAIIGAGATARSAVAALVDLGVERLHVIARREQAAAALVGRALQAGLAAAATNWQEPGSAIGADVVVSTVPASAGGELVRQLPHHLGTLFDVIYDPWPTPLAAAWAERGAVIGGLELLVQQAVGQVALMTGVDVPPEVLRAAAVAAAPHLG